MILADTSAWVEYDRATGSAVDQRIANLIALDGPLAVTQPIVMKIVAGARDQRRQEDLIRLLERFPLPASAGSWACPDPASLRAGTEAN